MKTRRIALGISVLCTSLILDGCNASPLTTNAHSDASNHVTVRSSYNNETPQQSRNLQLTHIKYTHWSNDSTGWSGGNGTHGQALLFRTVNGGVDWTNVTPSLSGVVLRFDSMCVFDTSTAWVALKNQSTNDTYVFCTNDGGKHWRHVSIGKATNVDQIDFSSQNDGWILISKNASMHNYPIEILETKNGGTSWNNVYLDQSFLKQTPHGLPLSFGKSGITFINGTRGYSTGMWNLADDHFPLFVTNNSGHTWSQQSLVIPPQFNSYDMVQTLRPKFFNNGHGVLPIAFIGKETYVDIYVTNNAGKTWSSTKVIQTQRPVVTSFPTENSWYLTDGSTLYSSINAGTSWMSQHITAPGTLTQIDYVSPNEGWAISNNNGRTYLLKTIDGGRTWSS